MRAFVLLKCLGGLGLPFSRIARRLKGAEHQHVELVRFGCSALESAEAGLAAFGVEACVFTLLSDLEKRGAVVCLPGRIWRPLVELPSRQPLPFGPLPARAMSCEHTARRHEEIEASLKRIAAKPSPAGRDEFESGIDAWWTRPLDGRSTPLDVIAAGNDRWQQLKRRVVSIEQALNPDTPDLSEPLGLPMSAPISAYAARAEIVEREKGLLRCEKLRARASQKFGTEIAAIWLATIPSGRGMSPLGFSMASVSGQQTSFEELEQRSVNKKRIPEIQEEFRVWAEKKFGRKGLRFIQEKWNDTLPNRRTPGEGCYDKVSSVTMRELITFGV